MVADQLANLPLYRSLSPRFAQACDFIYGTDLSSLPSGKHLIDGENMFVILARQQTRRVEDCRWESHQKYIDVQVMLKGSERIGVGNIANFAKEPYDPELEVYWLEGDGDILTFAEGTFMIFWPHDAHKPGIAVTEPEDVVKAVVKIAV